MIQIRFAQPEAFYLLLIIPAVVAVMIRARKSATPKMLFSSIRLLGGAGSSWRVRLRPVPSVMSVAALMLLIVALARPQSPWREHQRQTSGIDIMLVTDVSESMRALDFSPNRLEKAKAEMKEFVAGRTDDQIGIVIFAKETFSLCPLTHDYAALETFIDRIDFDLVDGQATAIGMGLANAVNKLKDSPSKSKVIILLTDGENNFGTIHPLTAAEIAKQQIREAAGFALGGIVPGPVGVAQLAVVHGGETITPAGGRARGDTIITFGDIIIELDGEKAPISTLNFLAYTNEDFYDGTIFHRVMENFMIQGGGFTVEMDQKKEGLLDPIKNEWKNGLKNDRGTISMARTAAADSATSQFFINVVDNASLDRPRGGAAYAVFGKVVEGLEIVDEIRAVAVSTHPKYEGGRTATVPVEPVVVESVVMADGFDRAALDAAIGKIDDAAKAVAEAKAAEFTKKVEQARLEGTTSDTGLVMYDTKVGDGETPQDGQRVEVHYTGWLTDGTKFDSSRDRDKPTTFGLTGVIAGWRLGLRHGAGPAGPGTETKTHPAEIESA